MTPPAPGSPRPPYSFRPLVIALLLTIALQSLVHAAVEPPAIEPPATAAPATAATTGEPGPPDTGSVEGKADPDNEAAAEKEQEVKRRTVTAGAWILVGITLVGLILVIGTILLGARARRLARRPLPPRTADDPFWHLRKKPEREQDPEPPEAP